MAQFKVNALPGQDKFGAIVTDLDPASIADTATRTALHDLWLDKGVVVFRGVPGGLDTQLALSEIFGEPESHPMMHDKVKTEHKAIAPIEYAKEAGNIYEVKGETLGGFLPWHFD